MFLGLDKFCSLVKDIGDLFWVVHPSPAEIIDGSAGEAGSSPSDNMTLKEVIPHCEQTMGLAF